MNQIANVEKYVVQYGDSVLYCSCRLSHTDQTGLTGILCTIKDKENINKVTTFKCDTCGAVYSITVEEVPEKENKLL